MSAAEAVDAILLTHLHSDHIRRHWWMAAGRAVLPGGPTSWCPQAELDFWTSPIPTRTAAPKDQAGQLRRSIRAHAWPPMPARGCKSFGNRGQRRWPGVEAPCPCQGHTPGHTGYAMTGGGQTMVIWGDICHVPEVQCARPDVTIGFDVDPAQAVASRRAMLQRAVDEDLLITGMHMSFPGFCRIARDGEGYRLQAQPWQYDFPE